LAKAFERSVEDAGESVEFSRGHVGEERGSDFVIASLHASSFKLTLTREADRRRAPVSRMLRTAHPGLVLERVGRSGASFTTAWWPAQPRVPGDAVMVVWIGATGLALTVLGGGKEVADLVARLTHQRVSIGWYAAAILIPPAGSLLVLALLALQVSPAFSAETSFPFGLRTGQWPVCSRRLAGLALFAA
jgi:hypothetical protein